MKPRIVVNSKHEIRIDIEGEGHSFCNLLRKTLLEEPAVDFAGYNIDHPLLASPVFTLKTKKRQANVVLREALEKMLARTEDFRKRFHQSVSGQTLE
ncbi:MAG: DNA-directed RNA polymerase subunit L [Candidatus Thorarchaeota archaeon]|nr:DNA-directed RNA polymerase subunit L [Candidatus Thorarchaeota archaeon]